MKYLQRIGRSLMLPVAVLPVAAILSGTGHWIGNMGWGTDSVVSIFLITASHAILDNIAILFAIGVGVGMAKNRDGAAALSALVGWLVVTTLLNPDTVAVMTGKEVVDVNIAFSSIENVLIGIVSGIVAGEMYNRFSHVQLPDAFAFFSGRRLVPILTAIVMLFISLIFYFIWPLINSALLSFGQFILNLDYIGAGLYGFFNRFLIPAGLHHIMNQVFWFDIANINDIKNFWSNTGVKGVTGMYQAGFYPIFMFGLPGAALAFYHTAHSKRRKQTGSLMLAAAFASFLTGVTEPLEFSFMFLAPGLYVVHAILTGLSMALASFLGWTAGFTFGAGFIDYFLSLSVPIANKPYMLLVQGLVFFILYYVIFRFLIVTFNLKTPGREDVDEEEQNELSSEERFAKMAAIIYEGLGGAENITTIDYCTTRLRVEVRKMEQVNQDKITSAGVAGMNVVGKHGIQVVVGTNVQFVADEMHRLNDK